MTTEMREITYRKALNEALAEELERDPNVFLLGEEVAEDLERPIPQWRGREPRVHDREVVFLEHHHAARFHESRDQAHDRKRIG